MKKYILAFTAAFLLSAALSVWYHGPAYFLRSVDPDDISAIHIGSGHTGNRFDIEDPEHIAYIVSSIQSQPFRKHRLSISYVGFWYTLSFCDSRGEAIAGLTINSDTAIRKDPFFYYSEGGMNLTDYLQALENQSIS